LDSWPRGYLAAHARRSIVRCRCPRNHQSRSAMLAPQCEGHKAATQNHLESNWKAEISSAPRTDAPQRTLLSRPRCAKVFWSDYTADGKVRLSKCPQ
jgi:hypothetical protein